MEAAASAITFAVVALQSIKVLHGVFSVVKDWPQDVARVASDARCLHFVLEQLASPVYSLSPTDQSVTESLQNCTEDVSVYAERLKDFTISPADRRGGRLWKRVKAVLNERDLNQMRIILSGHVDKLSLLLNLQHRDGLVRVRDQVSALNRTSSHGFQSQKAGLDTLHDSVQSLSSVSSQQHTAMMGLLLQIQQQLPVATSVPWHSEPPASDENLGLRQAVERLCALVDEKPSTKHSEDAESIVDDLSTVAGFARDKRLSTDIIHSSGRVQQWRDHDDRELRKIQALFQSLSRFTLQPGTHMKVRYPRPTRVLYSESIKHTEVEAVGGRLCLTTFDRKFQRPDDATLEEQWADYTTVLSVLTTSACDKQMVKASLYQTGAAAFGTVLYPTLSVYRVIPSSAEVFQVIWDGDLQSLRELFQDGRASPQDHHEHGWSLLHFAAMFGELDIARFLIDNGADIDEAVCIKTGACRPNQYTPLLASCIGVGLRIPQSEQVLKTLLLSGADPYWDIRPPGEPEVDAAVEFPRYLETFMIILTLMQLMQPGLCLYNRLMDAVPQRALLEACVYPCMNRGCIDALLKMGVSIHAVDSFGRNCLHLAIQSSTPNFYDWQEMVGDRLANRADAIAYLLELGADVQAPERLGETPSYQAYTRCAFAARSYGSFHGDLWDAALARAGLDIWKYRRSCPRRARYTDAYTRKHFEDIWEGFEQKCPYWDDTLFYLPGDELHDEFVLEDEQGRMLTNAQQLVDLEEEYVRLGLVSSPVIEKDYRSDPKPQAGLE
ncbi:hypothetical protein F4780DRAFT_574805 [Xylariomycetidae sp. FL0641]|nr:hypothetical protein F4780DRAFT_574805 [Xylariomycetidae sp. FL0641]